LTLSHRGVLFLDALPEFPHSVLESIRQPREDRVVTVSRTRGNVTDGGAPSLQPDPACSLT
jgi:magnesium chelatase family protein